MASTQSGPLSRLLPRHHAYHFGASLHRASEVAGPTGGIDRVGPMDLTVLASDHGSVPMNMGAVLEFEQQTVPLLGTMRTLLDARLQRVPRFRQRLYRPPPGGGRPVWVDDPNFRLDEHLSELAWPAPGGRRELLDVAAELVCRRVETAKPLWQAILVTDQDRRRAALVLVMHHVLADGLGGLAALAALADGGMTVPDPDYPRPQPTWRQLAVDAARERVAAVGAVPRSLRRSVAGLRELGLARERPHLIEHTSLHGRTSDRRRLATIELPLADIVSLAHRVGGTVNDVMLAGVVGALQSAMRARGEHPNRLVISVPISGRAAATADRLGNNTGVRPIAVPAIDDDQARLATIVAITRGQADAPRASSAGPLGVAFRLLSRLGLFRAFVEHQRLIHTFETNLRGPSVAMSLGGHRIRAVIPMVVNPGNVGISFVVLSYAGVLGVTLVADPLIVPEQDAIAASFEGICQRLLEVA
jgi:diacylglycerol O-acyltransferase